MDGAASLPNPSPTIRRAFEFCRLEPQLLALAYEQLLPIIRPPTLPRQAGPARLAAVVVASATTPPAATSPAGSTLCTATMSSPTT